MSNVWPVNSIYVCQQVVLFTALYCVTHAKLACAKFANFIARSLAHIGMPFTQQLVEGLSPPQFDIHNHNNNGHTQTPPSLMCGEAKWTDAKC